MNNWSFSSIIVDWIWPRELQLEKIWWIFEPVCHPDPDWTRIWTLGAWTNSKSGFNLELLLRFQLEPEIGSILESTTLFWILRAPLDLTQPYGVGGGSHPLWHSPDQLQHVSKVKLLLFYCNQLVFISRIESSCSGFIKMPFIVAYYLNIPLSHFLLINWL